MTHGKDILVTGGCGYIGSHVTRQLSEAGYRVTVIDDLSKGFKDALIHGERLVVGDIGDKKLLGDLMAETKFAAALHFAASIAVEESVAEPLAYYDNNVAKSIAFFDACRQGGIERIVFSSTAAVYGEGSSEPLSETAPRAPMSPYGRSKAMMEDILRDATAAYGGSHVILRYFNVAGADPKMRMGLRSKNATHLIKICCEAGTGRRSGLTIFGDDYPTRDGTCIRDYIHVEDLADAHVRALAYLLEGGAPITLNCGYGRGFTVKEVVETFQKVTGRSFPVEVGARRPGDVPAVVADASKIREIFGWQPRHDDLEGILRDAFNWELKLR